MYIFVHLLATNVLPLTSQGMSVWLKGPFQVCRFFATSPTRGRVPCTVVPAWSLRLLRAFQLDFCWVLCLDFRFSFGFSVLYNHPLIVLLSSLVPVLTAVFKATCMSDLQITISLPDFEALTAAVAELARVVQRIEESQPCALDFPGWEGTLDPYLPLRAKVHWWCVSYH